MTQLLARFLLLLSPMTLGLVAAVAAVAASVLLGVQDGSAGVFTHR